MMKIVLFAALLASASAGLGPVLADTLYTNANGYTLDGKGTIQRFSTLVVGDDGKVKAALKTGASLPAKTQDAAVDGKHRRAEDQVACSATRATPAAVVARCTVKAR